VILVGIPIIALLAVFVALGFSQLHRSTSAGFLGWFENQVVATAVGGTWIAKQVLKLTSWVAHELGQYFEASEHLAVQFVSGIAQVTWQAYSTALGWPAALYKTTYHLLYHDVPRIVHALTRHLGQEAHAAVTIVKPVQRIVYRIPKLTHAAAVAALAAALPGVLRLDLPLLSWLRSHFTALKHAVAHAGDIATTVPRVIWHEVTVPVGYTLKQIRARLRRLERITVGGLAVSAVALALTKMGVNWIRCNNVKRIGRGLCGAPGWLVNLLAAGVVEAFVVGDLCAFTDLLIFEAEQFVPTLTALVDAEDALIGCHGTVKPIAFALQPLALAPMYAASPLAA
jgi:hypothetical protein